MAYNLKIIEYPNGEIQIRYYSVPMRGGIDSIGGFEENVFSKDEESIKDPFHNKRVREVDDFDSLVLQMESNRFRNCNRTKQMVYSYSRCADWEWFITFTFSKDKIDRYDFDKCSFAVRNWLKNQRRFAPDLMYLVVPEQHKDGAWHFHGLLCNTGDIKFIDSGVKKKGDRVYNMIKWQYGFTTASKVKDIHRVAKYIGKYITKNICDLTPGRQRYYVSQNLPSPKVSTFFEDNISDINDFINVYLDSVGKKLSHVSSTRDKDCYTQVTYFEGI